MLIYSKTFLPFVLTACCLVTTASSLGALPEEKATISPDRENKIQELDAAQVSEAFGHLLGKNLESLDFEFDMPQVIKGIQDSLTGKESPLNETQCIQAISLAQEKAFQKLSQKNLDLANAFLEKNALDSQVVEIEKGKLQYKIEKRGHGNTVEASNSPLIRYTGKIIQEGVSTIEDLNDIPYKVFGSSQEDDLISLDETIAGFREGIVGMKEGEKRTLYVHPSYGYGTSGYLPPNSLLVFNIEVVKAHAEPKEEETLTNAPSSDNAEKEIATSEESALR